MEVLNDEVILQAIKEVKDELIGIEDLYEGQYSLLTNLMKGEDIFYTASTNSGKTLPTVMFPLVIRKLANKGLNFPTCPRILYLTPLNSLQLSLVNNVTAHGIECNAVNAENVSILLESSTPVLFIIPETLKKKFSYSSIVKSSFRICP